MQYVNPNQTCSWTASADGQATGADYAWYENTTTVPPFETGTTASHEIGESIFALRVTVVISGRTESAGQTVKVYPTGSETCF